MPILRGPMYSIPPMPVKPRPSHHRRSALIWCTTCPTPSLLSSFAFQLSGTSWSSERLSLEPEVAPEVAEAVVMGLRVVVGSICGGLKTRYIGLSGEPSNL